MVQLDFATVEVNVLTDLLHSYSTTAAIKL